MNPLWDYTHAVWSPFCRSPLQSSEYFLCCTKVWVRYNPCLIFLFHCLCFGDSVSEDIIYAMSWEVSLLVLPATSYNVLNVDCLISLELIYYFLCVRVREWIHFSTYLPSALPAPFMRQIFISLMYVLGTFLKNQLAVYVYRLIWEL